MKQRLLLLLFTLSFLQISYGQVNPIHRIGCHHRHHATQSIEPLTNDQRELLNASIARSDTFDILRYVINIDVTDYTNSRIAASTTVSVVPKMTNQSYIRLDLYNLQVDSVTTESGILTHHYDGEILQVDFATTPSLTDTIAFTVHYQGVPHRDASWGGFYFENGYIYNLGIGISSIPPNFGKVWYPCFDSFVERATYEYHVKSAGTFRAHCQGEFLGEIQLGGDTVIRSFAFEQAIPTHLSAIAVSNYQNINFTHEGNFIDIPVRLTAKPTDINSMNNVFQNVGAAIDACEYWYGPYAWQRVGYVLTTDGALEIPTNIAYPQYMVSQSVSSNNRLLSHELGHLWWGDVVTPYNHNDMWLKEGPAEYSSHLMEEWLNGQAAFTHMVKMNHLDVLQSAHLDDDGFQPLSPMPDEHIYGTHTYYKGASVMHNLRGYLGDEAFRLGMSQVQQEKYFQTITPEEFRDELEEATGINLHPFFEDQVFKPGFSTFVTDSFHVASTGASNYQTTVYLQQKLRACPSYYTNVPLEITLVGADNQRVNHMILASNHFFNTTLESSFEPVMVILNGHNKLNQARMDNEFKVYNGTTLNGMTPYVEMQFNNYITTDSSLVRIEHIWAAPDAGPLGPGITEISDMHYWIIDGLWKESDHFRGIFPYYGANEAMLDFALYHNGEQDAVLVYRANSSQPWTVYTDFTLGGGSLTDGNGSFIASKLRKGQYAFAKGDITIGINETPNLETTQTPQLYPIPTKNELSYSGYLANNSQCLIQVFSLEGRVIYQSAQQLFGKYNHRINTESWADGTYLFSIQSVNGNFKHQQLFTVMK